MDPNVDKPQDQNFSAPETTQVAGPVPVTPVPVNTEVAPIQPATSPPQEPVKKKSSILTIAVIFLLVAVFALVGYILWSKYTNQTTPSPSPSPVAIATPVATIDPTVNWNTYKNTNFGIEFKYPKEWRLINDSEVSTSPNFDTGLRSSTRKGNQNNEDFVNYTFGFQKELLDNYNTWKTYDTTKLLRSETISELLFEKYIVADMYHSLNYIYKTSTNEIFRFNIFPYEEDITPVSLIDSINQVLSTFKFIEASPSSAAE